MATTDTEIYMARDPRGRKLYPAGSAASRSFRTRQAKTLRKARLAAKLPLEELAQRTELSVASLSDYERGATCPTTEKLDLIARALSVPTTSLLPSHPERKKNN